jgi:hypothetical protein
VKARFLEKGSEMTSLGRSPSEPCLARDIDLRIDREHPGTYA